MKIRAGKIDPLPEVYSTELKRVVEWCLMQDNNRRPSTSDLLGIPRLSVHLRQARLKSHSTTLERTKKAQEEAEETLDKIHKETLIIQDNLKRKQDTHDRMRHKAIKL